MNLHFLTKIEIDHEMAFKTGLRDSYAWHQKIWEAFPERDGEPRDFLTRLDEIDGGLRLLLLSPRQASRPDWCPEACWTDKEVSASFFSHSAYRFSLLANPTKKVKSDKNGNLLKNSRRVPLVTREDLLAWLQRKGEQHGFTFNPDQTRTVPRPRQSFIKKGQAGLHAATEFIGELQVTQTDSFQHAALKGIGSAKAFGFGMLCLSPLKAD
jgi:CRISPR system Cascade subunit CasE